MPRRLPNLLPLAIDKACEAALSGKTIEEGAASSGVTVKTFKAYLRKAWDMNLRHRPNGHLRRLASDVRAYLWLPDDWRTPWRNGQRNLR